MKIFKDKEGNKLTTKEFFSRWKSGIENMTPIQKMKADYQGKFINFLGLLVSLIAVAYFFQDFPNPYLALGLILIFLGSSISSYFTLASLRQQIKMIKDLEKEVIKKNG